MDLEIELCPDDSVSQVCSNRGSQPSSLSTPASKRPRENKSSVTKASETFVCGLAGCKTSVADRVPGFTWCRDCKRIYDALARMSKVQNEEAWWQGVKANPKELKRTVLNCRKQFPGEGGVRGKSRLPNFKLAEYRESVKVATVNDVVGRGKLMWKEEYIDFAKSLPGGSLSRQEAEQNWEKWSRPDSGVNRMSSGGPANAPLLLQVQTGIYVDEIVRTELAKEAVVSSGQMKKPTEAAMAQLREKVMAGHENVAGLSAGSMDGMSRGVLANLDASGASLGDLAIGSAVAGEGLCSISLRQQVIQNPPVGKKSGADAIAAPLDDELEDEDGVEGGQEQRPEEGESHAKKARKEKYFESDRVVAKQIASMRGSIAAWKAECEAIIASKNAACEESSEENF
eukprot:5849466-Amphidinium_carterae.1